ncbi:hypothetical protein C2857_004988 [Epichloe festucae Fl1]|uniref:chitinase n=1 Tax=Epichloe festucae (strain Fl1) TaxID=877507 RepID=A0A7S9PX47_EPIFF|nr:hypothetical protein C2857_004988 [Epichloe festucae Fl1]
MITGAAPEGGFKKIGYFEAWNYARSCLQMNVLRIDSSYTHVHFSFAEIDNNFNVVIPERMKDQWDAFISNKTPFKKILAFGGWAFSTEAGTAHVLPQAVSDANRDLFARRVVQFAVENKLDGLNFDWEYPGATDINNVPGSEEDGPNYLKFLANVRKRLPRDKSLSIAAPASFWYLKAFPIRNIARVVDYIVYMTYDFMATKHFKVADNHSNYIRPMGQTINALTMITKAGVPSAKIIVGVSSYGRSFRMESPGCTGPDCRYLGTRQESKAKKGRCTDTAGYIANAELREIIDENKYIKKWYDSETDTDYLVYDDVEWVAYMNEGTKMGRSVWYELSHFGGTSDWAVDLQYFLIRPTDPEPWGNFDSPIDVEQAPPCCYARFNSLEELDKAEFDKCCGPQYILATLGKMMDEAVNEYNNILKGDYDKYFGLYANHVAGSAHRALRSFLTEKGNKYFNCKVVEEVTCCRGCEYKHGKGSSQCKYCEYEMCAHSTPWGVESKWMNVSQPCPNDMSKRGLEPEAGYDAQTVFWDLLGDYADKFWTDVSNELGVPTEKFHITPERRVDTSWTDRKCDRDGVWSKPSCHRNGYWFHAPEIRDFHESDVYNPKTVVKSAIDAVSHMGNDLEVMSLEISLARFEGRGKDLVDAVSVPVLMMQEALKAMKKVAEFGKDIEEKDKKMLALNFLMALFFFLPAVGNAVASVGLATLGRFLATLGELGNIGQGIYDIVDDPKSAPLAIFGIILGAGALKDIAKVRKAADLQRGMSSQMIKSMGGDVEARLNIIKRRGDTGQKQDNLCLV